MRGRQRSIGRAAPITRRLRLPRLALLFHRNSQRQCAPPPPSPLPRLLLEREGNGDGGEELLPRGCLAAGDALPGGVAVVVNKAPTAALLFCIGPNVDNR